MGRWQPDARTRLERAAVELFAERGFDDVTVPEITSRAGLTTRTFFRHFADKREVLFADAELMPALAARLVADAPPGAAPMAVMADGLPVLAAAFEGRLAQLTQHKAVIERSPALRERELRKMEQIVDAIAAAWRHRGVDALTAAVVAETSVGVVKVSLRNWIDTGGSRPLASIMAATLKRLGDSFGSPTTDATT